MSTAFKEYYGNSLVEIMAFFEMDPINYDEWIEFKAFWLSLTEEQRRYYRLVDLSN